MSLEKQKAQAQKAFNQAANLDPQQGQKQRNAQASSTVRNAQPQMAMNGPKPPVNVRQSLDRAAHMKAQQKLAQKEQVKNHFAKAAHYSNDKEKRQGLTGHYNQAAKTRSR